MAGIDPGTFCMLSEFNNHKGRSQINHPSTTISSPESRGPAHSPVIPPYYTLKDYFTFEHTYLIKITEEKVEHNCPKDNHMLQEGVKAGRGPYIGS